MPSIAKEIIGIFLFFYIGNIAAKTTETGALDQPLIPKPPECVGALFKKF